MREKLPDLMKVVILQVMLSILSVALSLGLQRGDLLVVHREHAVHDRAGPILGAQGGAQNPAGKAPLGQGGGHNGPYIPPHHVSWQECSQAFSRSERILKF